VSLGDVDDSLAKRTLVRAEAKTVIVAPVVKPAKPEAEDKTKAEAGKAKVEAAKAQKIAAQVTEPKPEKRKFTLQVGSFQDKSEADTFFRQLENTSYKPYMVEAEIPGKGQYYRVRVGGFGTFDEAVEAKGKFEESQHVIAYVTRLK